MPCGEVAHILDNQEMYLKNYPQCQPNWTGSGAGVVTIEADPSEATGLGFTATIRLAFGASMWIAIWIHAIATEYYLFTTQSETNRLRELSTKRQNIRRTLQDKGSGSQ
ncbi:hypothetical protein RhiJN_05584 [Ceratobasidium sp. AG-Ba]|nr:hypothetical protein RhiJN_05584 [Ceratobasidium sp. AG-Ba]